LRQLISPATKEAAPSVIAFVWFEIKKIEGDPPLVADFRLVSGSDTLREKGVFQRLAERRSSLRQLSI
jgi:hypothetical protein